VALPNTVDRAHGYTGEGRIEIYLSSDEATSERVWHEVMEKPARSLAFGLAGPGKPAIRSAWKAADGPLYGS